MNPYITEEEQANLTRAIHAMPPEVQEALQQHNLAQAYRARPAYQKNDYVGWIIRAKRAVTRHKRLAQMIRELQAGDVYMKMDYKG